MSTIDLILRAAYLVLGIAAVVLLKQFFATLNHRVPQKSSDEVLAEIEQEVRFETFMRLLSMPRVDHGEYKFRMKYLRESYREFFKQTN